MNPFALLLGLLGTGAIAGLGDAKKDAGLKNPKSEKPNDPVTDTPTTDPVIEEPAPEDPVTQEPVAQGPVGSPQAPEQTGGTGGDGGETQTVIADGTVQVMGGRVATLSAAGDDITGVRIVSGVNNGTITVNPDGTFALVMTQSDFTGSQSFTYEATHADGTTSLHEVGLEVTPGAQEGGWGTGENHYMLATDEDGRVIVEYGEDHTSVYISGSDSALSLADIAKLEGLSVSQITGSWLAAHSEYGQSEDMALAEDAGMALWNTVSPMGSSTSNWLLYERGYTYSSGPFAGWGGPSGESEMNPLYVGAWGEGDRPVMLANFGVDNGQSNVVVQGLHFTGGAGTLYADNVIFDDIEVSENAIVTQWGSGITIRDSYIHDTIREPDQAYNQGFYADQLDGLLVEGVLADHNGWTDDYTIEPNMFSHNIYIDAANSDVTLRDTITMRASATGAQVRSGGFIEDNLFLDNNVAVNFVGGDFYDLGPQGQYTLFTDNVVTSGGGRGDNYGARTMGVKDAGQLSSLVDNIIAHMSDPNNPEELATKVPFGENFSTLNPYYDDTIIWNWASAWNWDDLKTAPTSLNAEGLDTGALDQTTIQNFAAQLLGDPSATIGDLADYLRAQADGAFDTMVDADLIIRFFQEGFGIAPDIRADAAELTFVPNDLGDGVRWDNRMNWSTDDLPGTLDGDSVNLNGNHVVFGTNATIDTLDFGPGGALNVYGGKLTVEGGMTAGDGGGHLKVEGAGQIWTEGSDGSDIDITASGGRFANTGHMSGADLTASGGQAILATGGAEYDVDAGHTLEIHDNARVGFDGNDGGTAILDLHAGSTLSFLADADGIGEISEFRSGTFGDTPDVASGIDLGSSALEINLAGLSASAGSTFTLMDADEIVGLFDSAVVGGLGARNATIVIDYQADTVTLKLATGTGKVSIQTVGQETDVTSGEEDLWATLTADHGLMEETALAMVPEEDEPLDVAA